MHNQSNGRVQALQERQAMKARAGAAHDMKDLTTVFDLLRASEVVPLARPFSVVFEKLRRLDLQPHQEGKYFMNIQQSSKGINAETRQRSASLWCH